MSNLPTLDLHGVKHKDAFLQTEKFVLLNSEKAPLKVITGYNDTMKKIVIDILNTHEFNYDKSVHTPYIIIF